MKKIICDLCGKEMPPVAENYQIDSMSFQISNDSGGVIRDYEDVCSDCTKEIIDVIAKMIKKSKP